MEYSQSEAEIYINDQDIENVSNWLMIDPDQNQRIQMIKDLANDQIKNFNRFNQYNRLEFGTSGLRGTLSYGYDHMNEIVIIQTVQGILGYLFDHYTQEQLSQMNITIGNDARHKSSVFADITAALFVQNKINVNYFRQLSPTPYVAFFGKHFNSIFSMMCTASHNPAEFNGYKVYTYEGVSIISPLDLDIQDSIIQNLEIKQENLNYKQILDDAIKNKSKYLNILTDESPVTQIYYDQLSQALCLDKKFNSKLHVKVQYSAMYGVGYKPFVRMAKMFNYPVEEIGTFDSIRPDPNFGGIKKPNPELVPNMIMLSKQAEKDTRLILVADPDSDRHCFIELVDSKLVDPLELESYKEQIVERDGKQMFWKIYNGSEIGIILCEYLLQNSQQTQNRAIISTAVTTHYVQRIAEANNAKYHETLTGFKFICNKAIDVHKQGENVLLAFEQAIGYSCSFNHILVNDKDGVSTGNLSLQLANGLYAKGQTIYQYLQQIYQKYGFSQYTSGSVTLQELSMATQLLLPLIGDANDRKYPTEILGMKVNRVRDLFQPGYDSSTKNNIPDMDIQSAEMLTFWFDKAILTLRMSGTEPLLKYYIETVGESNKEAVELLEQIEKYVRQMLSQ